MGQLAECCCTEGRKKRTDPSSVEGDQPLPIVETNNAKTNSYIKLKHSLPFCKNHINYFIKEIRAIGKNRITMSDLRE